MMIWHLVHSTFALIEDKQVLVFDYWLDEETALPRSLESGIFPADAFKDANVSVFSSHKHGDHFSPIIFEWRKSIPNIRYILSSDIAKKYEADDVIRMKPHDELHLNDLYIKTLKSTDAGVAFLIKWQGKTIYFAGDLHLWLWSEETKNWNSNMKARFEAEMALLENESIDIAFIPFDIRQKEHAPDGMKWFMSHIKTKQVFAMHFGHEYRESANQISSLQHEPWYAQLIIPTKRGESFKIV